MLIASAVLALVLLVMLAALRCGVKPRHPLDRLCLAVETLEERVTPSTYTQTNIAYGPDPADLLDVSSNTTYQNAPIVVLVHGGGWVTGSKTGIESYYASYFLGQGFVVMAPNFPLVAPNGQGGYVNQFPIPVEAVALAVSWLQAHAAQYGGNPGEVLMFGISSGTNIAAMLTYDPTGFSNWGLPAPLTGIVGYFGDSGVYDYPLVPSTIPEIPEYLGPYYGAPQWDVAEPITFVGPGQPPALIVDGTNDTFTNYLNSSAFVNALKAAGDNVTYKLYSGYQHLTFTHDFATSPAEQKVLTNRLQSIGL
jgi:acetyl esterase/lipase